MRENLQPRARASGIASQAAGESGEDAVTGPAEAADVRSCAQLPDYEDLFEHAPVGYAVLDEAGCIVAINCAGAAMLGWDAGWLAGKPFSRWVVNGDRQHFQAHRARVRDGAAPCSEELRIRNRQGRTVSLRLYCVRETAAGEPRQRCVLVDISGEQQSARTLRRLQSQIAHLARLNTAGELASSLAHELNQPLGTVVLNCEAALRLLKAGPDAADDLAEALNQAREAACFAGDVVRHLRGFLKNTDKMRTLCELPALIRDVSNVIDAEARDNDVELRYEIATDLPPLSLDSVQIEQVLVNLAHNSIEAMRERAAGVRQVRIAAHRDGADRVLVSVADTGPGLDDRQLHRAFTAFFTTKMHGMGMGLPISRTIIEAHGGRLWAQSELGKGATFFFTLPVGEGAQHGG